MGLPDSRALEDEAIRSLEAADRAQRIDHPTFNMHRIVVGFRDDDDRRYALVSAEPGGFKLGRCIDCKHDVFGDLGAVDAVRGRDAVVGCMYCQDQLVVVERLHQSGMVSQL